MHILLSWNQSCKNNLRHYSRYSTVAFCYVHKCELPCMCRGHYKTASTLREIIANRVCGIWLGIGEGNKSSVLVIHHWLGKIYTVVTASCLYVVVKMSSCYSIPGHTSDLKAANSNVLVVVVLAVATRTSLRKVLECIYTDSRTVLILL